VNELVVIVEGETEQTFVRDQLAAHLVLHNTIAWPVLPGRRRIHGGVKKWEVARQDIIRTLKERRYCSTMFDYYAMPTDWPGREEATGKPWPERASHVEAIIHADIVMAMGWAFGPNAVPCRRRANRPDLDNRTRWQPQKSGKKREACRTAHCCCRSRPVCVLFPQEECQPRFPHVFLRVNVRRLDSVGSITCGERTAKAR